MRIFSAPVFWNIRTVAQLVGRAIDLPLAQLVDEIGEGTSGSDREAVLAALNGVLGDYLAETKNPLAIEMQLCFDGRPLDLDPRALSERLPGAGQKLLVLIHGSAMNDRQWNRQGHDHGAALAGDLAYTPLYLHYNSGLHISTNGRALASLLERLVNAWPEPIDDLVLLGFSMGGLVARSACHYGEELAHDWRARLSKLVCLGTPHHGAPLERSGVWADLILGMNRYSAPFARLGRIRSAGITDLGFGNILDEHWAGRDRFRAAGDVRSVLSLPKGVDCYAIAATRSTEPMKKLPGDGLVPIDSALGRHEKPELTLPFPAEHQWIGFGLRHLDLLDGPEVYATIRSWLSRR
jgi:pimeloyl-ACP methyl ester carboxylesterase